MHDIVGAATTYLSPLAGVVTCELHPNPAIGKAQHAASRRQTARMNFSITFFGR